MQINQQWSWCGGVRNTGCGGFDSCCSLFFASSPQKYLDSIIITHVCDCVCVCACADYNGSIVCRKIFKHCAAAMIYHDVSLSDVDCTETTFCRVEKSDRGACFCPSVQRWSNMLIFAGVVCGSTSGAHDLIRHIEKWGQGQAPTAKEVCWKIEILRESNKLSL